MKKKSTKKVTKKSLKTLKAKRASKVKRKKYVTAGTVRNTGMPGGQTLNLPKSKKRRSFKR